MSYPVKTELANFAVLSRSICAYPLFKISKILEKTANIVKGDKKNA